MSDAAYLTRTEPSYISRENESEDKLAGYSAQGITVPHCKYYDIASSRNYYYYNYYHHHHHHHHFSFCING